MDKEEEECYSIPRRPDSAVLHMTEHIYQEDTFCFILHYASFFSSPQCNNTSPVNLLSVYFPLVDLSLIHN